MAGHSHWAGIKHRKAAQDKKRSKHFSKFSKAIMIAAREGGGDPEKNLALRYEGYAPGGVAVMIEAVTDNRNRTAPELRNLFAKHGGNLANPGSVAFMFERKGLIGVPTEQASEDEVFEAAVEAGADDVQAGDDQIHVTTAPESFDPVKKALTAKGWELTAAELAWVPSSEVTPEAGDAPKVQAVLDELDDHDDVQGVHTNYLPAE